VKQFNTPADSFKNLGAEGAATLISAATDIALVIDAEGIIIDLSLGDDDLPHEEYADWIDRPWIETVTAESRSKVDNLLRDTGSDSAPRWRQVNHPSSGGADLPVLYATVPIGSDGKILAIGRNAAPMAELQQKLLRTQQSVERKYREIRHIETRYRLLFQLSSEAVFIVNATDLTVLEANPAAGQLLGLDPSGISGRKFSSLVDDDGSILEKLLLEVRTRGRADPVRARLNGEQGKECFLSATLFRQDGEPLYLIRASAANPHDEPASDASARNRLLRLMETAPDGFVVTGPDGRIITANRAFLELTQIASEDRLRGESLDRWLGRPGVDLNVLTAHLREHGYVRLFGTSLRGEYGSRVDVEISATRVMNGDEPSFGFMIRDTGLRLDDDAQKQRRLSRPAEQLTELVGRLPLKDLVQESTNMVERYCIEAALEITGKNRTSAAEILGLSRQSLYVKLRRYGIGDLASENGE